MTTKSKKPSADQRVVVRNDSRVFSPDFFRSLCALCSQRQQLFPVEDVKSIFGFPSVAKAVEHPQSKSVNGKSHLSIIWIHVEEKEHGTQSLETQFINSSRIISTLVVIPIRSNYHEFEKVFEPILSISGRTWGFKQWLTRLKSRILVA